MKKETSDAIDAKLRAEPDYKELSALLDEQSDARKDRLAYELTQSQRCEPSQNQGAVDMEPKTRAIDNRILELKDTERLSFTEIADRLNLEGLTNQAGGKFTRKSVAGRYYRFKEKKVSQDAQACEGLPEAGDTANHANVATPDESEPPEPDLANDANVCEDLLGITLEDLPCEPSELSEHEKSLLPPEASSEPCEPLVDETAKPDDDAQYDLPSHMVATLRKLIREELQAMTLEPANLAKPAKPDYRHASTHATGCGQ